MFFCLSGVFAKVGNTMYISVEKTTLKEIKRIAAAENALTVDRWNHKTLTNVTHKIKNRWYSASVYGLGAVLVEDTEGNYYYASSRSSAAFVLFC